MKKAEAKSETLRLFGEWTKASGIKLPHESDAWDFFYFLQTEHPHVLRFQSRADKWRVVHGWLIHGEHIIPGHRKRYA